MVAICMATYQPEPHAFRKQVESLRAQTFEGWHCWVVDDGSGDRGAEVLHDTLDGDTRFTVVRLSENVGFYRNFERALAVVARKAPWIALSDQDDVWDPDKIERLLASADAGPSPSLVYGDVRITDSGGHVLAPTYWIGRTHNEDDLAALLFANTVTGAACLFKADLLEHALPFPPQRPSSFHDHWLALVARCSDGIRYVDEPVQSYVQHEGNAIGHQPGAGVGTLGLLRKGLTRPWARRSTARYYDDEVARLSELARALLKRSVTSRPSDLRVLRAVATLHDRRPALAWLILQSLREMHDPSVTMIRRRRVLASVLWTQVLRPSGRGGSSST